jgi:hypothetical protein
MIIIVNYIKNALIRVKQAVMPPVRQQPLLPNQLQRQHQPPPNHNHLHKHHHQQQIKATGLTCLICRLVEIF